MSPDAVIRIVFSSEHLRLFISFVSLKLSRINYEFKNDSHC
jgi:hypothetical protein